VFDGIAQDIRHALRSLRRSPGFVLTVVATLAVSIGVNVAVFTLTKAALSDGFPLVEGNDRILYITTTRGAVYYPDFTAWRTQAESFEDVGLARGVFETLDARGLAPQTLFAMEITANTFGLLRVRPMLGRDFLPADERPGAEPVVILRHDLWVREFGEDPTIVGRSVRLGGSPATVIGVMPEGFSFPEEQQLWTPLVPTAAALNRETFYARYAFGRLTAEASAERARVELGTIGQRLAEEFPRTNENLIPVVQRFDEWLLGPNGRELYVTLWIAVSLVLLIGCANVGNLLLGRSMARSRDAAIRSALGAGRGRIVRQLVAECLALAAAGGVAGWLVAVAAVRIYSITQADSPITRLSMDAYVIAYALAISCAVVVLIGLAAAIRLARLDVNVAMKGSGVGEGRHSRRTSGMLVGAQATLAGTLLVNAGVMVHSFVNISTADVGVEPNNVLSASLYVPPDAYPDVASQVAFYERLEAKLLALPEAESAALGLVAPTERVGRSPYELAGARVDDEQARPAVADISVSAGYFRTLGSTVLAGRDFNELDRPGTLPVVIVNERFASRHWPGESALGQRLRMFRDGEPQTWLTVVGVVSNIVQNDATRQAFEPVIYLPYRQSPSRNMFVFVRARGGDPRNLIPAVSREVYSLDANLPVPALMPLTDRLKRSSTLDRDMAILLLVFGTIALSLAAVGNYAVVARAVVTRTHEIGVRVAVGASGADIRRLVFRTVQWPLLSGLALGLIGAFAVNHLLQDRLVGVSLMDPWAFTAASVVLVLSAIAGCAVPARRAMGVDPVVALKCE
jgi:predicted permease